MKVLLVTLAAGLAILPQLAAAQSGGMVSATDPSGMAQAMNTAGYATSVDVDSYGDPLLTTDFLGYEGQIVFYGCDEANHDGCDLVQFTVGLDRQNPMPLETVNELIGSERFVSISLDEDGDPWITWDVVTLGGIPAEVFLHAVGEYAAQINNVAETVFAEEEGGT